MEAGNIEPARAPPSFQHSPLFVRAACWRRSIRQTIRRRISALAASAPRDRRFHRAPDGDPRSFPFTLPR